MNPSLKKPVEAEGSAAIGSVAMMITTAQLAFVVLMDTPQWIQYMTAFKAIMLATLDKKTIHF